MSDSARHKSPYTPGDVIGGKYRVDRVIGAGGMGVVLAATHLDLEEGVALKCILPGLLAGKGSLERFLREARAAAKLRSEHVARVLDVARDEEGRPFMVLELLEGADLSVVLDERGPLPVTEAVEYVLQACEALVEAHGIGLVHRDLKPQNLFVTKRVNGAPLVKVLDFGIAKAIGPLGEGQMALTDSAAIIGSPLYMAPEQMRSARNVDVRSDIWALGVILYQALVGRLPFPGETVTEICLKVVGERPRPLQDLRGDLPAGLVQVVMRCLAKEPSERFADVGELAVALEPFADAADGARGRAFRSFAGADAARGPRVVVATTPADPGRGTALTVASDKPPPPKTGSTTAPEAGVVVTGTSWAGASALPPGEVVKPVERRRRGMTALVVLAGLAAVAGMGGLVLGRLAATGEEEHLAPAQASAARDAPSAVSSAPIPVGDLPASVASSVAPAAPAAPVEPVAPAVPDADAGLAAAPAKRGGGARGGGGGGGGGRPTPREPAPAAKPASAATPAATAAPAPAPAPVNGAPILR